MDWSRAKTYLIITFLFLDILLGVQYWNSKSEASKYVETLPEQMSEVQAVLATYKIKIATDIPTELPKLGFLRVRFAPLDPASVARRIVGSNATSKGGVFEGAGVRFTATGAGQYSMELLSNPIPYSSKDDHSKSVIVHELAPYVWDMNSYKLDYIQSSRDAAVRFLQWYHDYPLFTSTIEGYMTHGQITSVTQSYLQVVSEESYRKTVLSAISAIRSLVESMDKPPPTKDNRMIRDIRLGYYSKGFNADEWFMAPMWRIVIDQDTYYVNALTGDVEQAH